MDTNKNNFSLQDCNFSLEKLKNARILVIGRLL